MTREQIEEKRRQERETRILFNMKYSVNAVDREVKISVHDATHKFDIYDSNKYIGGITTSPWIVGNKNQNTGGKDRVSAELLWLTLYPGNEHRVMIMTDREMALNMFRLWQGCSFPNDIEVIHCNLTENTLETVGILSDKKRCNLTS